MEPIHKHNNPLFYKLTLGLFILYFIVKPFYILPSGSLQMADLIMLLLLFFMIFINKLKVKIKKKNSSFIILNLLFISYIAIINILWTVILGEVVYKMTLYYIFNFLACFLVIILFSRHGNKLFKAVYWGVLISILLQTLLIMLLNGVTTGRDTGFFNNPNQLGYFSVVSLCLLIYSKRKLEDKAHLFITALTTCFFLSLISLSRGAIGASVIIIGLYILKNRSIFLLLKRRLMRVILGGFLLISFILTFFIYYDSSLITDSKIYYGLNKRVVGKDINSIEEVSTRGYDRIFIHPQYLIFGAGEGGFWRFNSYKEFHSTLGNIFLSYGLVGFLIFTFIIINAFKYNRWREFYLFVGIMVYGLTHNGIRNTLMWIFIALIACDLSDGEEIDA
ncbi:O-antigen ligase family protein [Chengkuizengella sediminis]|uniref:O-antigen ligase family protein n=1 Tax=Chengkuizengella sediminis TaxID=1885917 RepID=UPI0013899F6E|nr:hypothetical protein [Chengkuizengella sediminis]NDI34868.1 hypothetical protein [Chengkuizengella sediminis]